MGTSSAIAQSHLFKSGGILKLSQKLPSQLNYVQCQKISGNKVISTSSYCLESVRKHDHDNFLATLLLPNGCRSDVFALRSFNIELAQVGSLTRESLAGRLRLEFWRETLQGIYAGSPPRQPVAMELHRVVSRHKCNRRWLRQLIDSREQLITAPSFNTTAELEKYAEESNSALYYLILQAVGVSSVDADHCASHLGKAEGIVKVLRGVPHLAPQRQILLPRQILAEHGVSEESVMRGTGGQKLQNAVYSVASLANHHMEHTLNLSATLGRDCLTALLPAVAVRQALLRLQRCNFDVYHPQWRARNTWLPAQLWWARFRNKLS